MKYAQVYIIPYLKKYKKLMISTILLGTLTVLSAALLTFTSGYLISRTAERPETILLVYIPIVGVRAFGISRAVFRYLERLIGHNAVLHILAEMRVQLYRALEPQALFIRSRFKTGDLLGTLADDVEHLQDVYIRTIFPTLIGLFLVAIVLVSLSLFDWLFALFMALCLSVVVFVYPLLSLLFMKKHQLREKEAHSKQYSLLTDAIFGIRDWMISGRVKGLLTNIMQVSRESHTAQKRLAYWHQSRTFQLNLFTGMLVILVGCWAGLQAGAGNIMPTYIAAFTLVTIPILEALIPVSHAIERIPFYEESLKRIELIEQQAGDSRRDLPATERVEPYIAPLSQISSADQAEGKPTFSLPKQVEIHFQNVSYRYPGQEKDAVQQFSLTLPQGHKLAILGKSGAGKSTLMQLLLGAIEPTAGKITIAGKEPANYGQSMYDLCGVLNQKPYLFATTVENNIGLGKQGATREDIEQVVRQVRLDNYIHSLPAGLKTQTEESGQRFSGGERQRIALARILLKDTPVVILDEPTVGLDPETEHGLIETIFDTLEGKTVIWITHHLAGMSKMDQIIFMEKGQIAMSGSHEELIATNERYRRLYELDSGA